MSAKSEARRRSTITKRQARADAWNLEIRLRTEEACGGHTLRSCDDWGSMWPKEAWCAEYDAQRIAAGGDEDRTPPGWPIRTPAPVNPERREVFIAEGRRHRRAMDR